MEMFAHFPPFQAASSSLGVLCKLSQITPIIMLFRSFFFPEDLDKQYAVVVGLMVKVLVGWMVKVSVGWMVKVLVGLMVKVLVGWMVQV